MTKKQGKILGIIIVVAVFLTVAILFFENFSCTNSTNSSNNPVVGNYRGDVLSIDLKSNKTFYFYNGVSKTSAEGNYNYTLSSDGSRANVVLNVTSGKCSYDGAVIYFFEGETWLAPTINGSEVVPRRMVKV